MLLLTYSTMVASGVVPHPYHRADTGLIPIPEPRAAKRGVVALIDREERLLYAVHLRHHQPLDSRVKIRADTCVGVLRPHDDRKLILPRELMY
jgi:hypothetical protein